MRSDSDKEKGVVTAIAPQFSNVKVEVGVARRGVY